jgi:hypothetical protein
VDWPTRTGRLRARTGNNVNSLSGSNSAAGMNNSSEGRTSGGGGVAPGVQSSHVFPRRLHGTFAAAARRGPLDFPELLLTPGRRATMHSLAMKAEVVHGAFYRFADAARCSLARGVTPARIDDRLPASWGLCLCL